MAKYRKKPVVIEAIQYQFYNKKEIDEFVGRQLAEYSSDDPDKVYDTYLIIPTLEGNMRANCGDYIIKGVNGEFYPCKPDIFEKTYDNAEMSKGERKYFLRFGDLPENGKSSIYRGETKVGEEQGVSVFDCTQDTFQLILPQELTRALMCDIQGFFNYSDRPLYLVSGIQVGLGYDNEPVIIDAKIEKEIPYSELTPP